MRCLRSSGYPGGRTPPRSVCLFLTLLHMVSAAAVTLFQQVSRHINSTNDDKSAAAMANTLWALWQITRPFIGQLVGYDRAVF